MADPGVRRTWEDWRDLSYEATCGVGVYRLMVGDCIKYIGRSHNVGYRLRHHEYLKKNSCLPYVRAQVLLCAWEDAPCIEAALIEHHRPAWNDGTSPEAVLGRCMDAEVRATWVARCDDFASDARNGERRAAVATLLGLAEYRRDIASGRLTA